jgi:Cft2 family RNA processing exonuclease
MTRDGTVDLLKDMIKIQSIEGSPEVYDEQAANKIGDWWHVGENFALPEVNVTLYPAGHVAGAKFAGVQAEGKTLLYTGDFCIHDTEILEAATSTFSPRNPTFSYLNQPTAEQLDRLEKRWLTTSCGGWRRQ